MQFFLFLVFLSFVSFAVVYLVYMLIVRFMGNSSKTSRYTQIIAIPGAVIAFNMLLIQSEYRYIIGSIPLVLVSAIVIYYYFIAKKSPQPLIPAKGTPIQEYQKLHNKPMYKPKAKNKKVKKAK